jgi:hypothetical protein
LQIPRAVQNVATFDIKQLPPLNDVTKRLLGLPEQLSKQPHEIDFVFSPNQQAILKTSLDEDVTRLYDLEGNLHAEYIGSIVRQGENNGSNLRLGFTQDGTQILTLLMTEPCASGTSTKDSPKMADSQTSCSAAVNS